jgi:inward rectifier potassium channel
MEQQEKDLGFGKKGTSNYTRFIQKNGDINAGKKGLPFFRPYDFYHWLTNINWGIFLGVVFISFIVINLIFATLYTVIDKNALSIIADNFTDRFWDSFFFSVQTITTVGYGAISPVSNLAKIISSIESFIGLLGFALVTGLLYGRFSKPNTKIKYSTKILVSPFKDGKALMFKMANLRSSKLIEAEVKMLLNYTKENKRLFSDLELQINKINFFALSWTVVHPITNESPFKNLTSKDIEEMDVEIIILVKAFDDTFSQTVYSRNSYKYDEFVWNAKFNSSIFEEDGMMNIDLDKIDDYVLLK